ncbi:DNA repair protein [Elizabethkingia bruuniana]|uniref:JAB domain-containing protein n=1 Tax=Elizabethkingia bruuniana TaxID=1756149 RepID=UPI0009994267|nr:JAB domain-containing protein [Elizabethkingia bruuniana]OPC66495.1 DNA repair protein [Elizabethkingia bruuniana]
MESVLDKDVLFNIAEIELVYKSTIKPSLRPTVLSSQEAYEILSAGWDQTKMELAEQFKVLLLSRSKKVLGLYELSTGGSSGTVVDPKLIFTMALKTRSEGIILAHNHPSGRLDPSREDIKLTEKIKTGGAILGIEVLDHIILTSEGYTSFVDKGLL